MAILKNFDLDEIRRKRARMAAGSGTDLVAGLNEISPDIAKLKVGETAKIEIPKGQTVRKFVMSITAKLNNLVPVGGQWEGRDYGVLSDSEEGVVYVQRGEDRKGDAIPTRNRGGGRPAASSTQEGAVVASA